jgi:cell division protein FtsZ
MVFTLDETFDAKARMKVVGVGGAGGNAVNRMVKAGLTGVEFISVNTDAMALENNQATTRIQVGEKVTKGLGAGANPEIGRLAVEEDRERIASVLEGSDMLFVTAGMGGGTGTGGAPVVAEIARELDILTVAIVTRPFLFEGKIRDRNARKGIDDLRKYVDTIIVIPNQKLMSVVDRKTPLLDAFRTADDVLYQATRGIADLISVPGLVNLDFADVKTIMKGMGDALMGTGEAEGEDRAVTAADGAIHSPLLDDISIVGAKGILINICGGEDMTLYDVSDATQTVYDAVGEDAETNIIFGAVTDPSMNGRIRVTVIATGFNENSISAKEEARTLVHLGRVEPKAEQMSIRLVAPQPTTPIVSIAPVAPMPVVREVHDSPLQDIFPMVHEPRLSAEAVKEALREDETVAAAPMPESIPLRPLQVMEVPQVRTQNAAVAEEVRSSGQVDIPPFLRKDNMRREQVFVSKGQVITHYEDDMEVPTFLRKQMQ